MRTLLLVAVAIAAAAAQPIRLHPDNPHYFLFEGKPTVLITSGEHYGAVLNREFDYVRYLDTLRADRLNLTRTFSGTYREVPGDFSISANTLAPAPGQYLAPWAQRDGKFDLTQWDAAYFSRLRDFVTAAASRGVVVELDLFCPLYKDSMWDVSPMNARNNRNGIGAVARTDVLALKDKALTDVQDAFVRKMVAELRDFDNLYYEICNEPYFGGVTLEFQEHVARVIADAESAFAKRHLIAQNWANGSKPVDKPNPLVGLYNFHYSRPPDSVMINRSLDRAIGNNETGFDGAADATYRVQGWDFLMAGGALYNNLDYSFTAGHENGDFAYPAATPGGGSAALRKQLRYLREFFDRIPFLRMAPAGDLVRAPEGASARALVARDGIYAVYVHHGRVVKDGKPRYQVDPLRASRKIGLRLPAGKYSLTWSDTRTGAETKQETVSADPGGGWREIATPEYAEDIALLVRAQGQLGGANPKAAEPTVATSYAAWRFASSEGWRLRGSGDLGASAIMDGKLIADFTHGAQWISIAPPDRVFLGNVAQFRFRLRGRAQGHPLTMTLRTHFMNFQKAVGEFTVAGEQEFVIAAPPGPGWTWSNGENDGRLHGPLRLGELRFEGNGRSDRIEVELLSIVAEGRSPASHLTVLIADSQSGGTRPRFQAGIRTLGPAAAAGTLRWQFRDWDGTERGRGERQVTTLGPGETHTIEIDGPAVGAETKFLEAEIALDLPGQEVPAVNPCWLAASTDPPRDAKLAPESPFGMGIYLGRYTGPDLERVAETARRAGVKWSREGFAWGRVEPVKGQFRWEYYDNLIATAKRNGISIYALLHGWAPWTKAYTEEGIDDYLAYIRRVVARYKGDIHHWEIWNEPNIFFWDGPKDLYAVLLAKSYAAIKQEDPSAQVLGMSTAGIDYNFIARTGARGGSYDALTIHPYRKVLEDRIFINELTAASRLAGGKPVWITEMGWAVHTPHNTLRQDFEPNTLRAQAELIARTYLCTMVSGVRPNTSWYDFRNDGEDPIYFEHNMGILYRDYRPKPAYVAFSTLTRMLENLSLEGAIAVGPGIFAYRFGGARKVIALWSPTQDAVATLPSPLKQAELVNAIGESRAISGSTVALSKGAPVYIVEKK